MKLDLAGVDLLEQGLLGLVIIVGDKMGLWGDREVVPFDG